MKVKYKVLTVAMCIGMTMSGCSLNSANRSYNKAVSAYEESDFGIAKSYFEKAIDKNPDKAEYHLDYGFTLLALKDYVKAREQFAYVIMDKDIPMVKENNKKAYRGIGITYLSEANFEDAITYFDFSLQAGEDTSIDIDVMFYKASALEQLGKLQEAVELYSKILEMRSEDASIYNARANLYRLLGEYDLSIADYDKAIELSPDVFNFYVGKFATLKEYGKNVEAIAVLEQAAHLKVTTDQDKYELAKVHFYQGNYEVAMNEFALSKEAGFTSADYFIGEIYLSNKDYANAVKCFKEYVANGNIVFAKLYNQMMTCFLQLEDYEMAKDCLDKAKKLTDISIQDQLLKNEIIYLEHVGKFQEALTKMEAYLKKYPEDEHALKDYYFLITRVQVPSIPGSEVDGGVLGETSVEKP